LHMLVGLFVLVSTLLPPATLPSVQAQAAPPAPTSACTLYPIALQAESLAGLAPGADLLDVLNGAQPGNFGWLTWSGDQSEPSLAKSLTAPGNASTYVNPVNASDQVVSVGDWVRGRAGVSNSADIRAALDALKNADVDVPVWDQ